MTASGAARSSTLPQRNGALNAQRTLTPSRFRLSELAARVAAAAAAAARTKQLFYPGSGLLELFLKSPPHNGEARTRERGERDKELVELKRVYTHLVRKNHIYILAASGYAAAVAI